VHALYLTREGLGASKKQGLKKSLFGGSNNEKEKIMKPMTYDYRAS
jgi:hypothetical protein